MAYSKIQDIEIGHPAEKETLGKREAWDIHLPDLEEVRCMRMRRGNEPCGRHGMV